MQVIQNISKTPNYIPSFHILTSIFTYSNTKPSVSLFFSSNSKAY